MECTDDRPPARELHVVKPSDPRDRRQGLDTSPGATLRAAREEHGLSIEDLARTTKISGNVLTALEEGDVERLPAMIFTRGFLKSYAREVGLDPDETADEYLAHMVPEKIALDAAAAHSMGTTPERARRSDDDAKRFLAERQMGRFGWLATGAAVIGLIAYIWLPAGHDSPAPGDEQIVQETAPALGGESDAASATGSDAARALATTDAIETPLGPLRFQLKPIGPCWLAAAADGTPVFARLLQAGDQETIEVHDELVLRVGDPGTLSFSINGREGRPLGGAGEPINVRITKENFREFLIS